MNGEFERRAKPIPNVPGHRLDPSRLWMLPDFELEAEYFALAPEQNGPWAQGIRDEYERRGLGTAKSEDPTE